MMMVVDCNTALRTVHNSAKSTLQLNADALFIKRYNSTSSPVFDSTTATSLSLSSSTLSLTSLRWRKRHRKRHSIWYDYNNYNENSTTLEWANPCGGFYDPNAKQSHKPNKRKQLKIYSILKRSANNDYKTLMGSRQQDIDISNIEMWWLHHNTYKFLPKLKMNSSIALKRWYRNMQTYVASFGYLRRIQLKFDHSKSQGESSTARELKELLKSSRNMLCELETAVNGTQSFKGYRFRKQLPQVNRLQMNKRLKLRTKQQLDRNPSDIQRADSIDLRFVKFFYYKYLKNMCKLLREYIKNKDKLERNPSRRAFNEVDKPMKRLKKNRHSLNMDRISRIKKNKNLRLISNLV
uniref:Uncharacterized protein n=1 Tax=Glossina morsitans morsitans TaxID=37546 RepID=A0A1B0FL76_GLOMM